MPLPQQVRRLTGVAPPAVPWVVAGLLRQQTAPVWIVVTTHHHAAERLLEDLQFVQERVGDDRRPLELALLPESPASGAGMREAFAAASERLAALGHLRARRGFRSDDAPDTLVLVTTPRALLQPVPALESLQIQELVLAPGQRQSFQDLLNRLGALDYDSEPVCEQPGQFAVRGGIVDVWPATADHPSRIDFFGDEIEDIRAFDPVTQRSTEKMPRLVISASASMALPAAASGISDYLGPRTHFVLIDPPELENAPGLGAVPVPLEPAASAGAAPIAAGGNTPQASAWALHLGELAQRRAAAGDQFLALFDLDVVCASVPATTDSWEWRTESLALHRPQLDPHLIAQDRLDAEEEARRRFLRLLASWQDEGYALHLVLPREGEEQRTRELLAAEGLAGLRLQWWRGTIDEGCRVEFTADARLDWPGLAPRCRGVVIVTETEIFGQHRQRRTGRRRRGAPAPSQVDQMLDFAELVDGDLVVHLQHGIGVFRGLAKIDVGGETREVLSVEFADHVTLHVPLSESHVLSRYVGLSKSKPPLGRIGSGRWEKTRQAAERATLDLAAELLEIQAKREAQPGHAFAADTDWQREFEGSFPFTETPDQAKAIIDTKSDMEKPRPMDRLVCGDVGFGKTEVAIRAAFKAVMGGKQVAVLVPTTVLAQQHLNSFRERMAGYPVVVEMLSRFRTRPERTRILADTAAGRIDILIGTHRLLQRDVSFRDLGLVVIDEEQRFGVKHKEVLKRFRSAVDVLSMSATPIPRTLYLAMIGARDLSVIETPPTDRLPIQTIVKSYDEKLVVEAIRHEVARGGQVFYLHNRVLTIDLVAARLRELLPDLAIGVGHGQMDEDELERMMTDFVAGRFQVLVCTTIIESGLDIPNCNTILIEGADRFGLSQLYQLRGRVGRFRHQAYAYLLLHRHARLLDVARERLQALRQHNQLGAGFRIAMRDLELRGAGNLLGPEQSGHVAGVGFELYCQLLRQSVARLKGEKVAATLRATVKLDFVFIGEGGESGRNRYADGYTALRDAELADGTCPPIQARIPATYVPETRLRIDFYRRLALAENLAQLRQLEEELRDRFGAFGEEVCALLAVTEIRLRAEQKGLLLVETEGNRLKCRRSSSRSDDFIMPGARFPRLTAQNPLNRLREICTFLLNLSAP
jgi:transcription-repair coupling factor (superfamily II helicase)